jgi:hypothetical protein
MPFYRERHPGGPFATLIRVAARYPDPENYDLESLQRLEMQLFQAGLRPALRDPGLLPGDELFEPVEYDDGSDEAFLRRLWPHLHEGEPPTRRKTSPPDHGTSPRG